MEGYYIIQYYEKTQSKSICCFQFFDAVFQKYLFSNYYYYDFTAMQLESGYLEFFIDCFVGIGLINNIQYTFSQNCLICKGVRRLKTI